MSEQRLTGIAAELLADFELTEGRPQLSEAKLERWAVRFATEATDGPDDVAAQLLAFALKLTREIGAAGQIAIGQLTALAGVLLLDAGRANALFAAAGIDVGVEAEKATGFVASKIPVGAGGSMAGTSGPLQTRLKK
jgi:hypothetical protein